MIMCLAQLLSEEWIESSYIDTISRLTKNKFTILDNGANEGKALTHEALAEASKLISANEVVLPDVLGNALETYDASIAYLKHYRMPEQQYMGVVQGDTKEELKSLIGMYAVAGDVTTLGIPRLLMNRIHKSVRLDIAIWIEAEFPKRFQVHFLGASGLWPKEPYYAARYELRVRSIDTSLPFNYGLQGVQLQDSAGATTRQIDRQDNYFTRWHEITSLTTVIHNMNVYKEWCNGTSAPSGKL